VKTMARSQSVVGIFDQRSEAESAIRELINSSFRREDISLIAGNASGEYEKPAVASDEGMSGTAAGASTGAVVGGIGGLLIGIGALAIPGIGPVIAAGPLVTTLLGAGMGAAAGGLIGALIDIGVPEEEAGYYAEGIRRGYTLVSVKTDDEMMVDRAVNIFERHNAIDIDRRAEEWRRTGWTGFDPHATSTPIVQTAATQPSTSSSAPAAVAGSRTYIPGYETYENDFRRNFNSLYANRGHLYDRYEPAYRHGCTIAGDLRYAGKEWSAIESDVRRDWEKINKGAWNDFKDSIRYGWDRVRGYSPAEASARTAARSYEDYADDFRNNFSSTYAIRGYTYDRYEPAYRYGYTVAGDKRYAGKEWSAIEADIRSDWEKNNQGAWQDFKDSIRYAWDRVRGYSASEATARIEKRSAA
jgi:hypothetical protein